jgi:DNA-binding CsgD family transcriptional regulator
VLARRTVRGSNDDQPAAGPSSEQERRSLLALSPREGEILAMLAADQDQKEIARKLFLSYATVRNHVQRENHRLSLPRQALDEKPGVLASLVRA